MEIDSEQIIQYWISEADEAFEVAGHLFDKKDFSYALFFCHLALEKILKAIYVLHKGEHAPPIHNLHRLSKLAGIKMNDAQIEILLLATSFNIEARYPDIKRTFRKKCSKDYVQEQMISIRGLFSWLKKMMT